MNRLPPENAPKTSHNGRYILDDDNNPVPCPNLMRWARWVEHFPNRLVRRDRVNGMLVSTVFLAIDYSYSQDPDHEPLLWETMVLDAGENPLSEHMRRYTSFEDALQGHQDVLNLVLALN